MLGLCVSDSDDELLAAAYGVPPEWIDTTQGAELWAVRVRSFLRRIS